MPLMFSGSRFMDWLSRISVSHLDSGVCIARRWAACSYFLPCMAHWPIFASSFTPQFAALTSERPSQVETISARRFSASVSGLGEGVLPDATS